MNTLVCKLGATGDVVRTTTLLRVLQGQITWITAPMNVELLGDVAPNVRCFSWDQRDLACDRAYDLVINLEDTLDVGVFLKSLKSDRWFGAYVDSPDELRYTDDSRGWFDLSLISVHGRAQADKLKLLNRRTYQDLVFEGLGLQFAGERYLVAEPKETGLRGDVAIAAEAGPVWPMKQWAHYKALQQKLEAKGLAVNILPRRPTLLEHMCDVRNHRCLVGGDTLPMHMALGTQTECVTLFNCTSPWEIHDYGLQTKIVSPLLEQFFYKRTFDPRATTAIELDEVLNSVLARLNPSA